ncbi:MAG: response regulator [Gemmataceae bacterium]|nr:response regulator [Gemmataceae bacterium]
MMRLQTTTVLVVHRLPGVRRFIALTLRLQGMQPVEADNGVAALELMQRRRPALVVAEAEVPGVSGQELAERAAAMRPAPAVFLVSACGRPAKGAEAGFLAEPFSLDELLEAVAPYLSGPEPGPPGLPQFA